MIMFFLFFGFSRGNFIDSYVIYIFKVISGLQFYKVGIIFFLVSGEIVEGLEQKFYYYIL